MVLLNPDFSQEVKPPAPGIYRARVVSVEQKLSKSSGDPMLNWKIEVAGHGANFTVWHITMLSGRGVSFLRRFIQAIDASYVSGPIDTDALIGRTLTVDLVQDGKYLKIYEASPDTETGPFPEDAPF